MKYLGSQLLSIYYCRRYALDLVFFLHSPALKAIAENTTTASTTLHRASYCLSGPEEPWRPHGRLSELQEGRIEAIEARDGVF